LVVSTAAQHGGPVRPRLDRPARVALLLGLAGVGYRLVLMLLSVPPGNSDEATFGLAAVHIAAGRELPVFLYGQRYMGVLESYLAAPLVALAGPGWPVLRAPLLLLYALFVYLVYRLARRLYTPWFAVGLVGLLALGSTRVIRDQMMLVGGRPEVKPAVVLLLLVAVGLAERTIRWRRAALALAGLVAGVAVWSDWLVLPYLAVGGLVLLGAARRDLAGWGGALLVAGFALGVLPVVLANLAAPPGQDSLSVLREISTGIAPPAPLADRLRGALLAGVPLATGLCPTAGCARWQQWFGVLYPALLVGAAALALAGLRGERRRAGRGPGWPVRPVTQLALVAGAALTLLGYVRSPLAASTPLESARYLSVLQISLPAVLWPLWWAATGAWRGTTGTLGRLAGASATAVLAGLAAGALLATGHLVTATPGLRAEERQARVLAERLDRAGLRHVYTDYWTCHRLVFDTAERVLCAVVDSGLGAGQNRYPAYQRRVDAAERPAFVLHHDSAEERILRERLDRQAVAATVTEIGDHRVYHPAVTVRPGRR
jgi:hypothetical protein